MTAAQARPEVVINLGGRNYKLVCDMGVLCRYEDITGKSAFNILRDMSANVLVAIVYAAIVEHHPEVTQQQVREWVNLQDFQAVVKLVNEFFARGMPNEPEGEKKI